MANTNDKLAVSCASPNAATPALVGSTNGCVAQDAPVATNPMLQSPTFSLEIQQQHPPPLQIPRTRGSAYRAIRRRQPMTPDTPPMAAGVPPDPVFAEGEDEDDSLDLESPTEYVATAAGTPIACVSPSPESVYYSFPAAPKQPNVTALPVANDNKLCCCHESCIIS